MTPTIELDLDHHFNRVKNSKETTLGNPSRDYTGEHWEKDSELLGKVEEREKKNESGIKCRSRG